MEKMEEEKKKEGGREYEMPMPEEAKGMHILLIDPDIASLMHSTSMLEEASYKVTGAVTPNLALSMMQERRNQYDIVMTAVEMRGMDCLSFVRCAKMTSTIPVALISYVEDIQLALRAIQLGACHFFVKPISRDDIRSLWQFLVRKDRLVLGNRALSLAEQNRDLKGRGKAVTEKAGISQDLRIRKLRIGRPDNDTQMKDAENERQKRKRLNDQMRERVKNRKREGGRGRVNKNTVKWNAELHAKFMKLLLEDDPDHQENAKSGQQAIEVLNLTQNSKEHLVHPCVIDTSAELARGGPSNQNPTNLGVQIKNTTRVAPSLMTTDGGFNGSNSGAIRGTTRGQSNIGRPTVSYRPQFSSSSVLNHGAPIGQVGLVVRGNYGRAARPPLLYNNANRLGVRETSNYHPTISPPDGALARAIDQIRRAYRENNGSGKASVPSNSIQTSIGNQAQGKTNRNQVNQTRSVKAIDSRILPGQTSYSQYANINSGQTASSSTHTGMFGYNMVENIGNIGSSSSSMNLQFHPPSYLNVQQLNNAPPSFMQQAFNQQTGQTGLVQAPNHPISSLSSSFYGSVFMQAVPQPKPTRLVQVPNHAMSSANGSGLLGPRGMPLVNPNPNSAQFMLAPPPQTEPTGLVQVQAPNHTISSATGNGFLGPRGMPLVNPNPNDGAQFSSIPSETASNPAFMQVQNDSNLPMDSTGFFKPLNYPLPSTTNSGVLVSNAMSTEISGVNQKLDDAQGKPWEAGLANQTGKPMNDFNGGFGSSNPSEGGFGANIQAITTRQTTPQEDLFLNEIFAELGPHFIDGDLKSLDSETNNAK